MAPCIRSFDGTKSGGHMPETPFISSGNERDCDSIKLMGSARHYHASISIVVVVAHGSKLPLQKRIPKPLA